MFKFLLNHRATEIHVVSVTVVILSLLILLWGYITGHLTVAIFVSILGLLLLIDIVVLWRLLSSMKRQSDIQGTFVDADVILQGQPVQDHLSRIDKRLDKLETEIEINHLVYK